MSAKLYFTAIILYLRYVKLILYSNLKIENYTFYQIYCYYPHEILFIRIKSNQTLKTYKIIYLQILVTEVLHIWTIPQGWTRALIYEPHVRYLWTNIIVLFLYRLVELWSFDRCFSLNFFVIITPIRRFLGLKNNIIVYCEIEFILFYVYLHLS